jgi:hypothetical protein
VKYSGLSVQAKIRIICIIIIEKQDMCESISLSSRIILIWVHLKYNLKDLIRKSGAWILSTYCKLYVKTFNRQILYGRTLKISKFLNSENVVLLLDPELLIKSSTRFILRWNLLNKTFISPFWVRICIKGTHKTRNFKILSTPLSFKYKIAE